MDKNEATLELLKVIAKTVKTSQNSLKLAHKLDEDGAPDELIDLIMAIKVEQMMDSAKEDIQHILEML